MFEERPYDVITFDCYGTLVDWEGGISDAFLAAAGKAGIKLEREQVLASYAQTEPEVQSGKYQSYASVLRTSAHRVAHALGWQVSQQECEFLPQSLPQWPPFEETNPVLRRLVFKGYTLGILSNVDEALLAETRKHLEVDFELIITAEQVGSYKPAHGHFETARQRIGPRRWLHVAQSYFHDVVPAVDLGIPVAWINRKGELPARDRMAHFEFRNLTECADHFT